jgi:MFS family permease
MTDTITAEERAKRDYKIWSVIGASAAGTVIEWYDFYIFGTLATTVAPKMYPPGNETVQLLLYLSTFAVGFVVRPFGALFFGRIGDLVGRKYAFLVTLLIMGSCTAAVGALPGYGTIGYVAPGLLILFRILQGLALGGEYGGAAIYVAEHVPDKKRGFYTSFIQITATLGLFIAIFVVIITERIMGKEDFADWGWRLPFLLSIVLVGISLYIRLKMKESPIFSTLKAEGKTSKTPISDALKGWENWKRILTSLFGATAGQGVVWYTGQFYALFFIDTILRLPKTEARIIIAIAIALGMPLFVFFGALSDRIGRKRIMMAGCLLGAVSYVPIFHGLVNASNTGVVRVDNAKNAIGERTLTAFDSAGDVVLPSTASDPNYVAMVGLVFLLMVFVTMVYGPIAAYLVEAFPAKVRYTSLSLPYHIGNGIFGGLLPLIGLYVCAATGSLYWGLAYPIIVASITFVTGSILLKETNDVRIWDELESYRYNSDTGLREEAAPASGPAVNPSVPPGSATPPS